MISVELNIVHLSAALGVAVCLGALAASRHAERKLRAVRESCAAFEARAAALRRELNGVAEAAAQAQSQARAQALTQDQALADTLARLQRVEREHAKIADRMSLVEFRGEGRSFDQAIDFARRGADPDKLAASFGLSRGEADLLTRLHGRSGRA